MFVMKSVVETFVSFISTAVFKHSSTQNSMGHDSDLRRPLCLMVIIMSSLRTRDSHARLNAEEEWAALASNILYHFLQVQPWLRLKINEKENLFGPFFLHFSIELLIRMNSLSPRTTLVSAWGLLLLLLSLIFVHLWTDFLKTWYGDTLIGLVKSIFWYWSEWP